MRENPVIENINNPEPKFFLHDELIYWMKKNFKINLHLLTTDINHAFDTYGNIKPSFCSTARINATLTVGENPILLVSSPVDFPIPKEDTLDKLYIQLKVLTVAVSNLQEANIKLASKVKELEKKSNTVSVKKLTK